MVKKRPRLKSLEIGQNKSVDRILPQVPKTRKDILRDAARPAKLPGKRISKSGNEYWETRQNRSDNPKSKL